MKDKKKMLVILGAIFAILMIGGTYAWLRITLDIKTTHTIHAGKLDLVLDDEASSGINIEKAVPTSDEKGGEQEGYTFELINKGTIDSNYTLYLDDMSLDPGEERMKDKVVKYSLERDGEELSSGLLPNMGSNPNRVLDKGTIAKHTTYTYTLKVWMSEDATAEDMGSVFFAKIRAEAEQTNIPVTKSDLNLTPASKEKVPIKEGEDPRKYTYTSSDWNVVKVDEDGNIEVIGPGTAIITKTDPTGGGKEEITVHVTVPIKPEFATNDKIVSIGNTTGIGCSLTKNNQTTCNIDLPEVTVRDGYEFVGWSTTEGNHEGRKDNIEVSVENNVLYPIVKIPGKQLTASIVKQGDGVEGIETENVTCDIKDAYNNEEPSTSCEITLPDITVKEGYEVIGWNTDSGATTGLAPGSKVEISTDITYYTIYKKKAKTLTATFMLNGAKSLNGKPANQLDAGGALKLTCTIEEFYGGSATGEGCEITVPIIEASDATPIVIGFNEDKKATAPSISGDTIRISENKMYYALTKSEVKTYTATFHRNNAAKIDGKTDDTVIRKCNIEITYNGTPQAEGCTPDGGVPSIEGSTNTPTVLGYSTKSGHDDKAEYLDTTNPLYLTGNVSYYAQTANNSNITYTATYKKGSNVINIVGGKESDVCHVPASYNGEARATSCTVEAPDYTVDEGYKKVGYSEEKDAKDGVLNTITLTKDTELYANAYKTSIVIEYYQDGDDEEPAGTSNAGTGESIALKDSEELGIEKKGYSFKGWSTVKDSTTVEKESGDIISGLAEGTTMKLYAVWIDDIAPVCTIEIHDDDFFLGDAKNDAATVTCVDEGSGFEEKDNLFVVPLANKISGYERAFYTAPHRNSEGINSPCTFDGNTMTCQLLLTPNWATDDAYLILDAGMLSDIAGNKNKEVISTNKVTINPKNFTITKTGDGVKGVNLESTKDTCTIQGQYNSCTIEMGNVEVNERYRWAGWATDKTLRRGYDSVQLSLFNNNDNSIWYPIVGPIFEEAYTYNQDVSEGTNGYCVTGKESTCQINECYKDGSECSSGTIFKYAVKSDNEETHRVKSLDDYAYNFYVLHDDGDKLTLQQGNNLTTSMWSSSGREIKEGPVEAINELKNATNDWKYVNDLEYTYGTTVFGNNSFTGCDFPDDDKPLDCRDNAYEIETPIEAKARLVTMPELQQVGCTDAETSCPLWAYNNPGGVASYHYWTSNAHNFARGGELQAMALYHIGNIVYLDKSQGVGIRPVIELTKQTLADWKSAD